MNKNIDKLLSQALTPDDKPGDLLNRRIINQVKEKKDMKHKMIRAAAIAAVLVAVTSLTAFAAVHFMTAGDVAVELGKEDIAAEFEKDSADNEVQVFEQGGYKITFFGAASGVEVQDKLPDAEESGTYVVIAAERLDGAAVTEDEDFVASILIQGLDPFDYNVYSMGGGATYNVIDGVYYMIMGCDDVEIFADRQLYVAVTTGPHYRKGYHFDEATGLISRNEDFDGINALFEIQLDVSKADQAAQERYLEEWRQRQD